MAEAIDPWGSYNETSGRLQTILLNKIKMNSEAQANEIEGVKSLYEIAKTKAETARSEAETKKLGIETQAAEAGLATTAAKASDEDRERDLKFVETFQKRLEEVRKISRETGDYESGRTVLESLTPFAEKAGFTKERWEEGLRTFGTKEYKAQEKFFTILKGLGATADSEGNMKFPSTFDLNDPTSRIQAVNAYAAGKMAGNVPESMMKKLEDVIFGREDVGRAVTKYSAEQEAQKKYGTQSGEKDTRTANIKNLEYAKGMIGQTIGGKKVETIDDALGLLGKSTEDVTLTNKVIEGIIREHFKDNAPDAEQAVQKGLRIIENVKDPKYKEKVVSDSLTELRNALDPDEQKLGTKKEVQDLGSGKILTYEIYQKPDGSKDWKLAKDRKWIGQQKLSDLLDWVAESLKGEE